jgi:predicted NBD/HSP70 family sugar kinase
VVQQLTNRSNGGHGELLQVLRDGKPRTRAELAAVTGLARSTIRLRVESLFALNLISVIGEAASSGGRPPSQFALNASARVVIGADIGANHAGVVLSNLNGEILARHREELAVELGPVVILEWLVATARRLLAETGRASRDLMTVGVGVPGPVEHRTGRPISPPIMPGWDGFDVRGWIEGELGVPVLVDNDVNIMAVGEHAVAFPEVADLLFVKVATGIGSAIISGGALQRGAQGAAGDIGHVQVERADGVACGCGNVGCLEAIAAGPAIVRALWETGSRIRDNRGIAQAAARGDIKVIRALRQAGRDVGEVLSGCVNLLNPSVIVLAGSIAGAGEQLLAGVREVVYERSTPLATKALQILPTQMGADAAAVGASILAIQHGLSPESIDAMVAETAL